MINSKLELIQLKAKEDVFTLLQGGNFSKVLGQGYDFSELRAYESSDDIRYISWINSAKLGEPYVKKMHEERELNIVVCSLLDGRMVIGKKQELLTHVFAVLAYSSVYTNNSFLNTYLIGSEFKVSRKSKNIEQIEKSIYELNSLETLGLELDYNNIQNRLLESIEEKSLLFMVSDFFEEIDLSVLAQKHEICVIMVRDAWEENPNVSENTQLINPLSNKALNHNVSKKAIMHYRAKLEEHEEKLYEHFHAHNIKYTKIYSEEEIVVKLERLFYNE